MLRPLVVAAVASSLLVPMSAAQDAGNLGRRLTLAVGPLFLAQRDEIASPVRYGGTAPFLEVGYTTRTSRRKIDLRVGGAIGTLRSALTRGNALPHQRTGRGWVNVEYSRTLGPPGARTRWLVGGLMSVRGTVILHYYGAGGNDGGYAFFATTVGPVVTVERARGERAALSARLSVPLVAFIGRPYGVFGPLYTDPRPAGIGLQPRVVTIAAFQAADFAATYTAAHRSGADLMLGYHVVVERYHDDEPFRFASQGVSLTLALRLGGKP